MTLSVKLLCKSVHSLFHNFTFRHHAKSRISSKVELSADQGNTADRVKSKCMNKRAP